ncbi:hypothetical protein [Planctomycetes bacterium K23_9]|uniref:SGNH hydrolase-type esterase domain-containing protein n=1 Tax=Stieleria marina TaxID=1930275 RepID=A0A517NYC0_9BACT|nr:hypothetical protein K239x_41330 [Planctomycetes bacterium K23_9]
MKRLTAWMHRTLGLTLFLSLLALPQRPVNADEPANSVAPASSNKTDEQRSLNVLFIGNSYTARHNLADVVKAMAQAGQPGLTFNYSAVIYGGRTLADHWRLGTQNMVTAHSLTRETESATIKNLELAVAADSSDKYAKAALKKHLAFQTEFEANRTNWDIVVLQSYRDDQGGADSKYAQFVPKFAKLAKDQGARVVLYVTTPTTQNAAPLTDKPDRHGVTELCHEIASLAKSVDAAVAPMPLVGLNCQTQRPDLTLRYVNDAHLNKTMAYLTACTLYAAIFDASPVGLPIDSITDIRYFQDDKNNKRLDRDGQPITKTFSDSDRVDLQRIAWESHQEFQRIR